MTQEIGKPLYKTYDFIDVYLEDIEGIFNTLKEKGAEPVIKSGGFSFDCVESMVKHFQGAFPRGMVISWPFGCLQLNKDSRHLHVLDHDGRGESLFKSLNWFLERRLLKLRFFYSSIFFVVASIPWFFFFSYMPKNSFSVPYAGAILLWAIVLIWRGECRITLEKKGAVGILNGGKPGISGNRFKIIALIVPALAVFVGALRFLAN